MKINFTIDEAVKNLFGDKDPKWIKLRSAIDATEYYYENLQQEDPEQAEQKMKVLKAQGLDQGTVTDIDLILWVVNQPNFSYNRFAKEMGISSSAAYKVKNALAHDDKEKQLKLLGSRSILVTQALTDYALKVKIKQIDLSNYMRNLKISEEERRERYFHGMNRFFNKIKPEHVDEFVELTEIQLRKVKEAVIVDTVLGGAENDMTSEKSELSSQKEQ